VNITFGSGSTNYAPTKSYTYTNSTCPDDGYYTITNKTSGCFGNHWHTITSDHTGSGGFMLVNASYEPGDFFLTTVTNLCPNTTYQFAAWLMNVLNFSGIEPNITFTIETTDSTILGQYSTGDIPTSPTPTWKQYGLYFTTPADNPQIVLRITNNAPGGNGNDIALDDITFRPCGPPIIASIENHTDTVEICEGNPNNYTFTAAVSPEFKSPAYQWQISKDTGNSWQDIPGANSLSYLRFPTTPGAYWYRLAVTEKESASILSCRTASNTVIINVHTNPAVNAGPDRVEIAGTPVTLQGSVTGDMPLYYWSPPSYLDNDSLLTPMASPPADISYTLNATSLYGCTNNDIMQVKVVQGIFVPNAFTPNGDGVNDKWRIPFLDPLLNASVNVYNRYGQMIYHAEGTTVEWDGTCNGLPQPAGAYVYSIRFKSGYPDMKGTILLIR
jgi:gliding motility-associated-like protein